MKVEVKAKIKLKLDDRKIELTSEEARELMVQLNQLFGNENPSPPISVPTVWPEPPFSEYTTQIDATYSDKDGLVIPVQYYNG